MTATRTVDFTASIDRPIRRPPRRSAFATFMSRAFTALAAAVDRAQLGTSYGVELSRHTGGRI